MLFAIALTILGTTSIVKVEEARHHHELRSNTLHQLSSIRAKLEGIINSTLFLTRGVVAYVAGHPEINQKEFHQLAKELLLEDTHIRNMGLARDNVITHMYPLKGNEAAIGLNYMDHPKQRGAVIRAIETRRTVVAGPVNLVQGGKGFISRTPVFLTPSGKKPGSGNYWGIASMVINTDKLFEEAGISDKTAEGLRVAIRGKDGLGAEGALFFGDKIVFKSDPVILGVTLPAGSWQIAAIPTKGWSIVSDKIAFFKFAGILISIMLCLSIWLFGRLSKERALRKSEEAAFEADRQIKELADSLSEVVYRSDANTFETLYINNAVENIFGYTPEEWIEDPKLWKKSIYTEDKERVFEILEDAKEKRKDLSYEYRIMKRDRTIHWLEDRITWQRDHVGNIVSISGLVYDITERKKAAEELQTNNELLDKIFSTSFGLIAYMDTDFNFIRVNKAYADADDHVPDFFIGKNHFDLYPNEENEAIFRRVLGTGEPYAVYAKPYEYAEHPQRGVTYWDWALVPALDNCGEVEGLLMSLMNVTEHIKKEEVLRASEEKYRTLLENLPQNIFLKDRNSVYISCNTNYARDLHIEPVDITGKTDYDFFPDELAEKYRTDDRRIIDSGEIEEIEEAYIRDCEEKFIHTVKVPLKDENGNSRSVLGIFWDITARKKNEEQLLLLEKALSTTNVGITITDMAGRIVYTNPAEAKMHGYSVSELIGNDVEILAPKDLRQSLDIQNIKADKTKKRESINIRKDGSSFPVYLTSDIVTSSSNDPIGIVTICEDITELKNYQKQLRNLTQSLQSAREEERKMIAREIHDEMGQSLTALKIDLSILEKKLPEEFSSLHKRTGTMMDIINSALRSVKRIAKDLRPEILDELGLEAAIDWYVREFSSRSTIKCDTKLQSVCNNTNKETSLVLFRVLQEAMTNILRHAKATRVKISLECKKDSLLLIISDNGIGIDKANISDSMSIGLIGMNERIRSVGGIFKIRGIRGVGTSIKVYIPGEAIKK